VLSAYSLGKVLAGTVRLRTPFYFIRTGSYFFTVGLQLYPLCIDDDNKDGMYATLLMPTRLNFGFISALFGLSRSCIYQERFSLLIVVESLS
jgi:hypothetical protein